jgi:fatty-acyl-CoA synthase
MNNSHNFVGLTPLTFLERGGRFHSERPAAVMPNRVISFGKMLQRTRRMASLLRSLGVKDGDRVGLLSHNSLQAIEAHYAIPAAGGVIVAFNPWLPSADIAKQLFYSGTQVLLVSAETYKQSQDILKPSDCQTVVMVEENGGSVLVDEGDVVFEAENHSFDSDIPLDWAITDENSPIAINFTSGTTGDPKGVMYSHRAAYLHSMGQVLMLGLTRKSIYFWSLPMFHVNGWGHMWSVAAAGAQQVIDPASAGLSYEGLARRVAAVSATHLAGAPRILRHLITADSDESELSGLTVLTGGAAPTPDLVKSAIEQGIDLIHQYGLSETCGPFVVCEPKDEWQRLSLDEQVSLRLRQGIPAIHAGVGLRVVDEKFQDVPWDGNTLGEVLMAGNTLAQGYYGNPEASEKAFNGGWFRSGDMAVIHKDGYLELKDRIKDVIFVETAYGWENISSIEIENVVIQFPGVRDVAVVGTRGTNNPTMVAFLELEDGGRIDSKVLQEFCGKSLPSFKVPVHYFERALPKTATGKVKKNILEEELAQLLMVDN